MRQVLSILNWLLPIPFCIHVCEEFIIPGGFIKWYNTYRPRFSYWSPRSYYIENAIFIALTFYGAMQNSPFIFLMIGSFLSFNAIATHIRGAIVTRRYSPGLVTGAALYLPITVAGYIIVLVNGYLSIPWVLLALAIGPLLEAIFALRPDESHHKSQ